MNHNYQLTEKGKRDYFLIQRIMKDNDQKAYAELMQNYSKSLYYTLFKMVKDKDDTEDLLLLTFEKAFRNLKDYKPKYSFSTWLFRIAINSSIDFLRKKDKLCKVIPELNGDGIETASKKMPSSGLDPEEQLIQKQNSDFVRKCIQGLSPQYKKVIELRYIQENTYEEMAKKINLPVGTIKAQVFRGKKLMYNKLKQAIGK